MKSIKIRNVLAFKVVVFSLLALLVSCSSKKDNCIKRLQEQGYSKSQAKEMCEDAERDSYSR